MRYVDERIHNNVFVKTYFPNGIPYKIIDGLERCAYCGSVSLKSIGNPHNLRLISISDDGEKVYFEINGETIKLYSDHLLYE